MTRILATIAPVITLALAGASFAGDMSERAGPLRIAAAQAGNAQPSAPGTAASAAKKGDAGSTTPPVAPAAASAPVPTGPKLNMNAPAKNPGADTDLRNCLDRGSDREVIRCTEGKG